VQCEERAGFLFAHDCDRAATQQCSHCNKRICVEHLRPGTLCVTCEKAGHGAEGVPRLTGNQADRYANDPYYYGAASYGGYHYYDERDRRAMRRSATDDTYDSDTEGDFDGS